MKVHDVETLKIEILTQEVVSGSSIEGELLNRESVQSSILKHLGLKTENRKIDSNEAGIAEMTVNLYLNFDKTLAHQTLFQRHKMHMNGRCDIDTIINYRTPKEPMRIISGNLSAPKVFYEAPPSKQVGKLMQCFLNEYNDQIVNKNGLSAIIL